MEYSNINLLKGSLNIAAHICISSLIITIVIKLTKFFHHFPAECAQVSEYHFTTSLNKFCSGKTLGSSKSGKSITVYQTSTLFEVAS